MRRFGSLIFPRSFFARLSLYIVLIAAAVFAVAFYSLGSFSYRIVKRDAELSTRQALSMTVQRIDQALRSVEVAVANAEWMVYDRLDNPEEMYVVSERLLESNPIISGSAVAFEPGYYPQKGTYFSPYALRAGDSLRRRQLGTADYEYHYMDWYQIPKLLDSPYWSEPYYDAGGGEIIMTTFSRPLHDRNGKVFAVLTADISLEWLTDMVERIRPYPHSYTMMIGRSGTYVVHPEKQRILNETIFTAAAGREDTLAIDLGRRMITGRQGQAVLQNGKTSKYVFYAPVTNTGWSVAVVCPYNEIFAQLGSVQRTVIGLAVLGLLVLSLLCVHTVRHMMRPLSRFADAAVGIAGGDFRAPLPKITGEDEMGHLYHSFEFMQHSLVSYTEELKTATAQRARIDNELHIAREIQMGMLPKTYPPFPERDDIDLYALLVPAREVGGDLYDFFIRGERLYLAIGDVSGKGVPAALLMAVTRSLFRTMASYLDDPARIVAALNDSIVGNNDSNMFVTMLVGIMDLRTGTLDYCNAGHNPPMLRRAGQPPYLLDVMPQLPVGLFRGYAYKNQSTVLEACTTMVFYTDGLTEAENESQEFFTADRLAHALADHGDESARELITAIRKAVEIHTGAAEQSDDLTMMTLRYRPSECGETGIWRELVMRNSISEIARLQAFVEQLGDALSLSEQQVFQLNLALEEVVSNVIRYAFEPGSSQWFLLQVRREESSRQLVFVLTDCGMAFDPTVSEKPNIALPTEELPVGGLGILLVRELMDLVTYRRKNGCNILIMTKQY